jgi:hypothetical protein
LKEIIIIHICFLTYLKLSLMKVEYLHLKNLIAILSIKLKSKIAICLIACLLFFVGTDSLSAQSTCQSAVDITNIIYGIEDTTFEISDSIMWFKITTQDTLLQFYVRDIPDSSSIQINSIKMYSNNCNNLTLIQQSDSGGMFSCNGLSINNQYFIKFSGSNGYFKISSVFFRGHLKMLSGGCAYDEFSRLYAPTGTPGTNQVSEYENVANICTNDQVEIKVTYPSGGTSDVFAIKILASNLTTLINLGTVHINETKTYTFQNPGSFWIAIIFVTPAGTTNSLRMQVIVNGPGSFDLSGINTSPCPLEEVSMTYIHEFFKDETNEFLIDWGDGAFTHVDVNSPQALINTHSYANCGIYEFHFWYKLKCCGEGDIYKTIHVKMHPHIDLTIGCPEDPVTFQGSELCQLPVSNWIWSFGDGHSAYTQNATHTYVANSQYNVSLTVSNPQLSCPSSTTEHLTFLAPPAKPEIIGNNNNCTLTTSYSASNSSSGDYFTWSIVNSDNSSSQCGAFNGSSSGTGINSVSITWNPNAGFIDVPEKVLLIVTVSNSNSCSSSDTLEIFECCSGESIWVNNEEIPPVSINNTSISLTGLNTPYNYFGEIVINGVLVIDDNFSFVDCPHILMCPQARIEVIQNKTLNVTSGSTISSKVSYMWDGIYTSHTSSFINMVSSSAQDAIHGIVSRNGGGFSLMGSDFNDNLYSVIVKPWFGDEGWSPLQAQIKGCTFSNSDVPDRLLKLPPYEGEPGLCGVDIQTVKGIVIGDHTTASNTNYFSYLT